MTTLKDIAKIAGVSHMTVSNVLNAKRTPTRAAAVARAERIRAIARDLDYRPHEGAQQLRTGRTGRIAMVGESLMVADNPSFQEEQVMVSHLAERLAAAGLHATADLRLRASGAFGLPAWRVDAAVLLSPQYEQDWDAVRGGGLPTVVINGGTAGLTDAASVVFDDAGSLHTAVDALAELGHRRIAFLNLPSSYPHESVKHREQGYLAAAAARNLRPLPGHAAGDIPETEGAMEVWLRAHTRPRTRGGKRPGLACVAYDPMVALRLYRAARACGLRIPEDLSVITFNDTFHGREVMDPALSCFVRPAAGVADRVCDLLARRLDGDEPFDASDRFLLSCELHLRGSVAAP